MGAPRGPQPGLGPVEPLRWPAEVTIAEVRALQARLLEQLALGEAPGLDLSQVRRLDAAGAQLVLAAHRSGVPLRALSAEAREALEVLGLLGMLGSAAAAVDGAGPAEREGHVDPRGTGLSSPEGVR